MSQPALGALRGDSPPSRLEVKIGPSHGQELTTPLCGEQIKPKDGRGMRVLSIERAPQLQNFVEGEDARPRVLGGGRFDSTTRVVELRYQCAVRRPGPVEHFS